MGVQFKQRSACNVKPLAIYLPRNLCGIVSRRYFAVLIEAPPTHATSYIIKVFAWAPAPLIVTCPCPPTTPLALYAHIASTRQPSFLLESGGGRSMGRYSYLSTDPYYRLSGMGSHLLEQPTWSHNTPGLVPFQRLAQLFADQHIARPPDAPPFLEGPWVTSAMTSFASSRHYRRSPQPIPPFLTWNSHF